MIVLGIDTSGYTNAVGVFDGRKVLADLNIEAKTNSLEKILPHIDLVLCTAGVILEDVGGIGVGLGPGSWTGIRVGVTVAKMLAFGTGKPVCGIPTLTALAYGGRIKNSLICSIISAGVGDNIYAAFYRFQDNNILQVGDNYVGEIQKLSDIINESVVLVGQGVESYAGLIGRGGNLMGIKIRTLEAVPSGSVVARLAAMRLEVGDSDDTLSLAPLYLRESTVRAFMNKCAGSAGSED